MKNSLSKTVYLKDYQVPEYAVDTAEVVFDIYEEYVSVQAALHIRWNKNEEPNVFPQLILDGVDIELESLSVDGRELSAEEYALGVDQISIPVNQKTFRLDIHNRIFPHKNTSLEGLYKSHDMFCTQCEAEGFRKITYYPDQPDIMARFKTKIIANEKKYPVLLSNGNNVGQGKMDDGRHWVIWEDPFPKPSYLFALVAGDLEHISDSYTIKSGRKVVLKIYTEAHNISQCDFAMESLKKSMKWDENVYGREYDLDIFMIVAVDHFNMGAMENKGLNIFNSACVLASKDTATDSRFENIERVVAHEYFHNWSGNRVTCRDWFQLSLKEGFTVFRDSEFSADMNSREVKRIEDADFLRTYQFAEDGGPMAHAVQPASYMEISNFYTLTVYEKGSEIVRMIHTLLGKEKFRAGSDLYFDRHDGQAVTCEEFVKAMEDASNIDLQQFRLWYSQAGTPVLQVHDNYDVQSMLYTVMVSQSCPATPEQESKKNFHIPFKLGVFNDMGEMVQLNDEGDTELLLELTQKDHTFRFNLNKNRVLADTSKKPIPSLLRGFTAPVRVLYPYTKEELAFLVSHDTDSFNRWDACQKLAMMVINEQISATHNNEKIPIDTQFISVLSDILSDERLDYAIKARLLVLPSEEAIAEQSEFIFPRVIDQVRYTVKQAIAKAYQEELRTIWSMLNINKTYRVVASDMGERALKNICLGYLSSLDDQESFVLMEEQYQNAGNMTDRFSALSCLVNGEYTDAKTVTDVLDDFLFRYCEDSNVVDQWFRVQSSSRKIGTLEKVEVLLEHELFEQINPNRVRALVGGFSHNMRGFHREDMKGYGFLGRLVMNLDKKNPQIATRLLQPLVQWRRYQPEFSQAMYAVLKTIQDSGDLSSDLNEVVCKSLA